MRTFHIYQKAHYSEYMELDIWSTIEIRIICEPQFYDLPRGAYPNNIFDTLDYMHLVMSLKEGEITYPLTKEKPLLERSCDFETTNALIIQEREPFPDFVQMTETEEELGIALFS